MPEVRVRFAPSPTGFLHIGSARTALFNWLFARHESGKFFLRIEDTDKERSKKEFLDEILSSLKWLGLDWDGELVFQSERNDYYRQMADRLIKEDKAYYDENAILFRVPKTEKIVVEDFLHGNIEFDPAATSLHEDLVIFKSDGSPTYNFAVVCDDAEMQITHVIRGDDHISNTPKQLPLYEALGFKKPIFCHIPLILGEDRSRMSKRHGATSIREYREVGYLPETLVNYLALLGWSPGNNQEVMGRQVLVQKFDLKRVLKTGAVFNHEKLEWMNKQYLKTMPIPALTERLIPYLTAKGYARICENRVWLEKVVKIYKDRIGTLAQLGTLGSFFFEEDIEYPAEVVGELHKDIRLKKVFEKYADLLQNLEPFESKIIEEVSIKLMKETGLTAKEFIHPCRAALTGKMVSPGFYDTVALLGKEKAVKRLRYAVGHLMTPQDPSQ
ncbi:MAG: hypothetical protein AUJ72_00980 [Candidatus Omnitrophica bacterium CG1_02_46_14]|nr:MAG: hypothetical protein AUJ72_00980 [Candidatus Omnitrophica bacterium CG1_02_46_14]